MPGAYYTLVFSLLMLHILLKSTYFSISTADAKFYWSISSKDKPSNYSVRTPFELNNGTILIFYLRSSLSDRQILRRVG